MLSIELVNLIKTFVKTFKLYREIRIMLQKLFSIFFPQDSKKKRFFPYFTIRHNLMYIFVLTEVYFVEKQ